MYQWLQRRLRRNRGTKLIKIHQGSRLNLRIAHSQEGKMEAQRAILASRHLHGLTVFFDADVVVQRHCLYELWYAMEQQPQLQLAYANVKALNLGYETVVEWIESVHYVFPRLLTHRKYFHGRGYIIRPTELFFLSTEEKERIRTVAHEKGLGWMRLDAGPLVDDIYLSRALVHQFGPDCIQQVRDAVVKFTAPRTLKDFYQGQRRLLVEIRRLDMLFPEHAHLQKSFERKPDRTHLHQMKSDVRFHHFLYRTMEKGIRMLVRMNIFISDYLPNTSEEFWIPLESTKDITEEEDDHV